jgi:hypothetical protein
MGMSVFSEDLPKHYYCEKCAPQDHEELLEGIAKGEKPWEPRRKSYEEEEAEKKKKKGKKGKVKRNSDPKEEIAQAANGKAKSSPVPEIKKEKDKKDKESVVKQGVGKRKTREETQEKDAKVSTRLLKMIV